LKFFRTPVLFPWLGPSLTWRIKTSEKHLYLTFDDGPVEGPTEFVLDVLKKENVAATFFCIGRNIERHPHVFDRIVSEGHAVGNHTFDHVDGWKLSLPDYLDEIRRCGALVHPSGGRGKPLFRPPYGRLTPAKIKALRDHRIVMWDVLTYDFDHHVTPEACLRGTLNAVRTGSIIIFHDSHKAARNMTYALPRFIDACRDRGYEFCLLEEPE
jgi:peptidoglycan/xylan/chitin deacetylase (PgdA/CDA1 family)